eukprot:gene12087-14006_t
MYDLSTDERFSENVFPMKGDISNSAAVKRRMDMEFGTDKHDLYTVDMYTNAALTNWECCRLFSVRSCEILLEGEIPFDCLSVINYTTHVQSVTNLPYQPHEIPFESFEKSVAADRTRYAGGDNEVLVIDHAHVEDAYMCEFGENYEMPVKPQMSTLQLMQKAAKKAGDVLSPEMIRMCEQKGGLHYVRFHFCPADCKQLFKGLAVDLLVGNKYAGGCYEKAGIARSSTGELYRLSADRALGNQVAESLNADRRDDHAGNLLIDSISIAAKWGHIPMHKLCSELKRTLHAIRRAVETNYEEFNSDVFRRLDLPLEVRSRNKEMLNTAIVLEDLHNLFNFMRGHSPFDPILPP